MLLDNKLIVYPVPIIGSAIFAAGYVFLQPTVPLFKPIESPETLTRDSRAPPESIVLTWRNTTA